MQTLFKKNLHLIIHQMSQKLKKLQSHFYHRLEAKQSKTLMIQIATNREQEVQPTSKTQTGYQIKIIDKEIIK